MFHQSSFLRSAPSKVRAHPAAFLAALCLIAGSCSASVTFIYPNVNPYSGGAAVSQDGNVVVIEQSSPSFSPPGVTATFARWTTGGLSWGPNTISQTLAKATNSNGSVVVGGTASLSGDPGPAFRWRSSTLTSLGVLPGHLYSKAVDVSADGNTVVGASHESADRRTAFRWTAATGMTSLGSVSGFPDSIATSITPDGSTIFGTIGGNGNSSVFRWTGATGMTQVAALSNLTNATLVDTSSNGSKLVGTYEDNGIQTGYAWNAQSGITPISGTPSFPYVTPTCVTADGSIVYGYIANSANGPISRRAFVWSAWTGLIEINAFLSSQGVSTGGYTIRSIDACSADGLTVACTGDKFVNDATALILKGVPTPSGLGVFLAAGAFGTRRRRSTN